MYTGNIYIRNFNRNNLYTELYTYTNKLKARYFAL